MICNDGDTDFKVFNSATCDTEGAFPVYTIGLSQVLTEEEPEEEEPEEKQPDVWKQKYKRKLPKWQKC